MEPTYIFNRNTKEIVTAAIWMNSFWVFEIGTDIEKGDATAPKWWSTTKKNNVRNRGLIGGPEWLQLTMTQIMYIDTPDPNEMGRVQSWTR